MPEDVPAQQEPHGGEDLRRVGKASWIARERLEPGTPSMAWFGAVIALASITFVFLLALGAGPEGRTSAEESYRATDGFLQAIQAALTPAQARVVSALSAAVMVAAVAFAARRLLHSELPALLAASLVAIDPAVLAYGRLALPVAPATAAATVALALYLGGDSTRQWWGAAAFAFAAFLNPTMLLWSPALALLVLSRGHIYAAPQHALHSGLQTVLVPGLGAVLGIVGAGSLDGCYQVDRSLGLFQRATLDLGGVHPVSNPITWFAGLGVLLYLSGLALSHVLREFRLQRIPGRLQVRLPQALARGHGRALWIAALALFAPTPLLWVPLFALALAAGVQELGQDARAFGGVVGLTFFVFALLYSARLWGLFAGDASALEAVPWVRIGAC